MLKRLKLNNGKIITYSIKKHPGAKKIKISVFNDDSVLVTIPRYRSFKMGEVFAWQKREWISASLERNLTAKNLYGIDVDKIAPVDIRADALIIIRDRLEFFCQLYGFSYNKVQVKKMRSRWGSCSRVGDLQFNYKIYFLPEYLRDYVIVHELCHTKAFNHSAQFWKLVEQTFPDYRNVKRELRKYL